MNFKVSSEWNFAWRWIPVTGILFCAVVVRGGEVSGVVRAKGVEVPSAEAGGGKYDSRKAKFFEKMDYAAMRDFVVWLETTNKMVFPKPEKHLQIVVQKDAVFRPHIMPVLVGTVVEWPNKDDIFHNVFSFSDAKQFDLGLYKEELKQVTFDKPGRVDVFCSIHKNMGCVILVLENPWFALTDADGRFSIRDVAPGSYRLKAWHERLPPHVQEIEIAEHGTNTVEITLGVKGLPRI